MQISFKKVLPYPLKEIANPDSFIWNKDFNFAEGAHYQISARSGVGKTTLLSIIYGVRSDYSGEVFIDGTSIRNYNRKQWSELRRNNISMVFQGLQLFDNLTVMENILIKNRLTDYITESKIHEMLEYLEIDNQKAKRVGEISFGQKQRVAIVRAVCQPFQIIMLDEPFSHLDSETTSLALELIVDKAGLQNATTLITSLNNTLLRSDFVIQKM